VLVLVGPSFPWWLSPIIGGLLLAAPLSVWSSRAGPGRWLRRHRLLLIPEEMRTPAVLEAAQRYAEQGLGRADFVAAVRDAEAHAAVLRSIVPRTPCIGDKARAQAALIEYAAVHGPAALGSAERLRLLGDASLAALRWRALHSASHPDWRPYGPAAADAKPRPERRKTVRPLQPTPSAAR
jgi:membrane glycosyltransferase